MKFIIINIIILITININKNFIFCSPITNRFVNSGSLTTSLVGSSISMIGSKFKPTSSISGIDGSFLNSINNNNNIINNESPLLQPIKDIASGAAQNLLPFKNYKSNNQAINNKESLISPSISNSPISIATTTTTTNTESFTNTPNIITSTSLLNNNNNNNNNLISSSSTLNSNEKTISNHNSIISSRIPKELNKKKSNNINNNLNTISEDDIYNEYNLFPSQISFCVGGICPNGECISDYSGCIGQLNDITARCPYNEPVRCLDGSCSKSQGTCSDAIVNNCTFGSIICPNGQCGPCDDYDGCSTDLPFQCPTGICVKSSSDCEKCENGHLKCFDGSCNSPCPFPPYYYKPILLLRNIVDGSKDTKISINSYESPLDFNSDQINIVDVFIKSNTFPSYTQIKVQPVADSIVETIKGDNKYSLNYKYQLSLLTPIINITASINGSNIKNFNNQIKFEFKLINNPTFDINKLFLGFINETTGQWEKVSNITIIDNSKLIGYSNHFTCFGVLTSITGSFGRNSNYYNKASINGIKSSKSPFSMNKSNLPTILGVVLGCIGACILIIVGGVILHHSSKHGGLRHWLISRSKSSQNENEYNNTSNNNLGTSSNKNKKKKKDTPKISESSELMLNNSAIIGNSDSNISRTISNNSLSSNDSSSSGISNSIDYNDNNNNNHLLNNNLLNNNLLNNNQINNQINNNQINNITINIDTIENNQINNNQNDTTIEINDAINK